MRKQKLSKVLAMLLAMMMLFTSTACNNREKPIEEEEVEQEEQTEVETEEEKEQEELEKEEEPKVVIDVPEKTTSISEWKAKNNDVIGWLMIPDTDINNPVVQTTNNKFYERLDELKQYNFEGCYWVDYECGMGPTADDLMRSTIIYGHNTDYTAPVDEKEGNRFSQLFHFTDIEWAKEHPYIYFSTEKEDLLWEVFACAYTSGNTKSSDYFDYIQVLKDRKVSNEQITEGQLMNIVNEARERSEYDYPDVEVSGDDKILTLSTCSYKYGSHTNVRYIIMAKLVTEEDKLVESANVVVNEDKKEVKIG